MTRESDPNRGFLLSDLSKMIDKLSMRWPLEGVETTESMKDGVPDLTNSADEEDELLVPEPPVRPGRPRSTAPREPSTQPVDPGKPLRPGREGSETAAVKDAIRTHRSKSKIPPSHTSVDVGNYRVNRLIGEGGMGRVYEAEHLITGRRVALKALNERLAVDEQGRRLFIREMKLLGRIEHPNVIRLFEVFAVEQRLFAALEILDGLTIRELLVRHRRFSWQNALVAVTQILAGLHAAHGQRPPIVHRDIKPENIMVLPTGVVKIMDFGIAKIAGERSSTETAAGIGSLLYMSPEQIDARVVDERTDLYSVGIVLYEMLAGHPPFHSGAPRELLNAQCLTPAPPLPRDVANALPDVFGHLLFRLLEKSPSNRPASAAEALRSLEQLIVKHNAGHSKAPIASIPAASAPRTDTIQLFEPLLSDSGRIERRRAFALGVGTGIILALAAHRLIG